MTAGAYNPDGMANSFVTFDEFAEDFVATFQRKLADALEGKPMSMPSAREAAPRETRHMFRPQRYLLAEAMAEAREFDGTRAGLQACLGVGDVLHACEPYGGIDPRIGWDTYIVTVRHPGWPNEGPHVAGFVNGPLVDP